MPRAGTPRDVKPPGSTEPPPPDPDQAAGAAGEDMATGRRRRGRRRKGGADEDGDPVVNPSAKRVKPEEFFEVCNSYSPEDWGKVLVYGWRLWPVIDRRLSGQPFKYIFKFEDSPPNADTIAARHGGGSYQLSLVDKSRDKQKREVCTTLLKIDHTRNPPALIMEELCLGHPDNRPYEDYLKTQGLHPDQQEAATMAQQPEPQLRNSDVTTLLVKNLIEERKRDASSPADRAAVSLMEHAFKSAMEAAHKQNDPSALLSMVTKVMELAGPRGGGDSGNAAILTLLTTIITETNKQNAALLTAILNQKQAAPPSARTQVEELAGLVKTVQQLAGVAPSEPPDAKGMLFQSLADNLPDIIGGIRDLGTALLVRNGGPVSNGQPGAEYSAVPGMPPAPAAIPRQGNPAPPPPAGGPPAQQQTGAPNMQEQQVIAVLVRQMLSAIEKQIPGDDWAQSFVDIYGRQRFEELRGLGAPLIMERIAAYPNIWQQVAPIQQIVGNFVAQFCAVDLDAAEEEEEPPAPVSSRRRAGKEGK